MFVFVQNYKSSKAPTYTMNECSQERDAAQTYAQTLLESSVDVSSVDVFEYIGACEKVEKIQWVNAV